MAKRFMRKTKGKKKAVRKMRANMDNKDDHTVVHKLAGSITPLQGLTVSNYVYTYWSPAPNYLSPSQSNPLFGSAEFNLYRNLYDQFRVNRVTIRIIPRANVVDQTSLIAQNDPGSLTQGKGVYYTVEDRDGIAPGYIGSMNKYASVKVSRLTSKLTRSYSPTNSKSLWFDCQDPAGLDQLARGTGLRGGITLYAESLPEVTGTVLNSVWADVEVLYSVTYRGKAMVNLQVNEDGSVTAKPVDDTNMEIPFAVKTQEGNNHAGAVDLSGAIIEGS
jgi:hypothetical protein